MGEFLHDMASKCPHPIPSICDYVPYMAYIDMVKVKVVRLSLVILDLSWVQYNHMSPYKWTISLVLIRETWLQKGVRGVSLLALKMEERGWEPKRTGMASRSWKIQGNRFPPKACRKKHRVAETSFSTSAGRWGLHKLLPSAAKKNPILVLAANQGKRCLKASAPRIEASKARLFSTYYWVACCSS